MRFCETARFKFGVPVANIEFQSLECQRLRLEKMEAGGGRGVPPWHATFAGVERCVVLGLESVMTKLLTIILLDEV
jgi:hypothetical protein